MKACTIQILNPLDTNEFFPLVLYNKPVMVHCTYQGISVKNSQIRMQFQSMKIFFILANSAGPDEKLYYGILSGSSLFAKVPIRGFQNT